MPLPGGVRRRRQGTVKRVGWRGEVPVEWGEGRVTELTQFKFNCSERLRGP